MPKRKPAPEGIHMNLTELKYIVAIARYGSVNAAAKEVYVAQPNLSKAIKNLEAEFGIRLFERSSTGMAPTEEGQSFIVQAKKILEEIEKLNQDFSGERKKSVELKISIPRASYASCAAVSYIKKIADVERIQIQIRECSALDAVNNILHHNHQLAVIRYEAEEERDFLSYYKLKGLAHELLMEFGYYLLTNGNGPLASREIQSFDDLDDCLEIVHGDERLPSGEYIDIRKEPELVHAKKVVQVCERGSQFDLLRELENAYMWVSPMPQEILKQYGLVQRKCPCQKKRLRDVIVYPAGTMLGKAERAFIEELKREAAKVSG